MPGIGMQELVIIMVVVMVIFGAGKIPEVMRNLGSGVREIREITTDPDDEIEVRG
jgi:sec-independent protein translocase protein TatA